MMVCGGIMLDVRTPLHFCNNVSAAGQRYRGEVLESYVRLSDVLMDVSFNYAR